MAGAAQALDFLRAGVAGNDRARQAATRHNEMRKNFPTTLRARSR